MFIGSFFFLCLPLSCLVFIPGFIFTSVAFFHFFRDFTLSTASCFVFRCIFITLLSYFQAQTKHILLESLSYLCAFIYVMTTPGIWTSLSRLANEEAWHTNLSQPPSPFSSVFVSSIILSFPESASLFPFYLLPLFSYCYLPASILPLVSQLTHSFQFHS